MAKTIRLTVAQALVKFLNNQYIEFDGKENKMFEGIFGIFGHGNVVGMGQALEEDAGDLIMRMGRNEQGMAHAAMGFAKQKRRKQMYACTSSVGPGAMNMVTAAATATANCIPVLFSRIRFFSRWNSRRIWQSRLTTRSKLSANIGTESLAPKF